MGSEAPHGLNPRQARFVQEYLVDCNATHAAIRAGYNSKNADVTGPRLLGHVGVSRAIAEGQKDIAASLGLDARWVIQKLMAVVERSSQAVPVLDNEGNATGEYRYDSTGVNRAAELLGKHLGMFKDKTELSGPGGAPIAVRAVSDLKRLDDDELEALEAIAERAAGPEGDPS